MRKPEVLGELFDVPESADYTHLRQSTIRDYILRRKIAYVKLGRRVFLRKSDLDQLIDRSTVPAIAAPQRRPSEREAR